MKNLDRKHKAAMNHILDIAVEFNKDPKTKSICDVMMNLITQFNAAYRTAKMIQEQE